MGGHSYIQDGKLIVTHNAGFFSCCSVKLSEIISYFNEHGKIPVSVDSSNQLNSYKSSDIYNIENYLYTIRDDVNIEYVEAVKYHHDDQFSEYRNIDYKSLAPFIEKYFTTSERVEEYVKHLETKYSIDYENTVAVYYRGNDKCKETTIASYDEFFDKCKEIREINKNCKFFVQTDELEFREEFCKNFNNCFFMDELPVISKNCELVMHKLIDVNHRPEFAVRILSVTKIISKCKFIITHTGNCGIWTVLYRNNSDGVHQYRNNIWT